MKVTSVLLVLLALSGCVSSIERHIEDWPQDMKITEHTVGLWDLQTNCYRSAPAYLKLLLPVYLACAEINLYTNTCDIYRLESISKETLEHEYSHCRGGDHGGDLQDYFDNWKRSQK